MKINDTDITFVVSGLLKMAEPFTALRSLSSVRRYFPRSRIILTVWDNEEMTLPAELYDELVVCDAARAGTADIRCSLQPGNLKIQNINRQIYSVNQGLKRVKTAYAVRMRTDFCLTGRNFLTAYEYLSATFPQSDPRYTLFASKILIPKMYTRDPAQTKGYYAFESSDFFSFGRTSDMLLRWNGVLESEADLTYFGRQHLSTPLNNPHDNNGRYGTEQYALIRLLRDKKPEVALPQTYCDVSGAGFITDTHRVLVSNFLITSFKDLGLQNRFLSKEQKSKKWFEPHRYIKAYCRVFGWTFGYAALYTAAAAKYLWRHYYIVLVLVLTAGVLGIWKIMSL